MDFARSNLVVYLPQSGDRLRRAGRPWFAVFSRRSIKNCELHSANVARQTDRLKTNYSVDDIIRVMIARDVTS